MSAREKATAAKVPAPKIAEETNRQLRALAHDLANSIETIMQAAYLLSQMQLGDDAKKWAELVDKAARECARINREIRDVLRANA
jgi:signal transduction histidine kinase